MVEEEGSERLPDNSSQENTAVLIHRAQAGDKAAMERLLERHREALLRFLHGRLSPAARSVTDTSDVVQEVFKSALESLERFEYRGLGSFWAYLREIGKNRLRHEERRAAGRRTVNGSSHLRSAEGGETPSEDLVRRETSAAFEAALLKLSEQVRHAFLLRFELDLPYEVIALECGYPSPDAARMAIVRAGALLAKDLSDYEP